MCLLSPGRNPHLNEHQIEDILKSYLNAEKVLQIDNGIDPDETTGHIDDIACFARPGEVICLFTDDPEHPFYEATQKAYEQLSNMTDAKGRHLKVHKLCCTKNPVTLPENYDSLAIAQLEKAFLTIRQWEYKRKKLSLAAAIFIVLLSSSQSYQHENRNTNGF